jgi:hypothetical protein
MTITTNLDAGAWVRNHNEALRVRSTIRAGGVEGQHNEALRVRSTVKAGGVDGQHNETLVRASDRPAISMRRLPRTTSPKEDRLELLVVRAGLRAGRARARARE